MGSSDPTQVTAEAADVGSVHAPDSPIALADISVVVLTVSDRSARGEREDRSGPAAVEALHDAGIESIGAAVIPDGREIVESALADAIEAGADLVLTLGGTGVGPRDRTPEGTRPLIELELPGIAEGLRAAGAEKIATAALSRGLAGVSRAASNGHRSVIVNLPGSTGGARDGAAYLAPLLPHLIDQLRGGDH
ncbi:MAG: MogA/MoaB family molybdenum cofactor biosynthesis protein [Solirubrobacterales bacterium]|nr:MogA/MoaB family molybdenum cofactor biosynthesis protein [Solirubrobacterales bacterium]MCB8916071.1 MogA/MoaB family molybdenum cofactor biosynthesis protein [Thermoleophilales bacterium]